LSGNPSSPSKFHPTRSNADRRNGSSYGRICSSHGWIYKPRLAPHLLRHRHVVTLGSRPGCGAVLGGPACLGACGLQVEVGQVLDALARRHVPLHRHPAVWDPTACSLAAGAAVGCAPPPLTWQVRPPQPTTLQPTDALHVSVMPPSLTDHSLVAHSLLVCHLSCRCGCPGNNHGFACMITHGCHHASNACASWGPTTSTMLGHVWLGHPVGLL
jgi:hypothetical protein